MSRERVIVVLQQLKQMDPWKGTTPERKEKFSWLIQQLNAIYGRNVTLRMEVADDPADWSSSGASWTDRGTTIVLTGRLSVITLLHEYAHVIYGSDETRVQRIACKAFEEVWPENWQRLTNQGRSPSHPLGMMTANHDRPPTGEPNKQHLGKTHPQNVGGERGIR